MPILRNLRPSGFTVCIWMVAAIVIYLIMITVTLAELQRLSGGHLVFDMMLTGYDQEYAQTLLVGLGPEGRQYYLGRQIPLDLIYPLLFGVSFFLLAQWLAGKLPKFQTLLFWTALVAVAAGVTDYLENFLIVQILWKFPDITENLVGAANIASLVKSGLTTIYFVVLLLVLLVNTVRFVTVLWTRTAEPGGKVK